MQAFDEAVTLRPAHPRGPVRDILQLQEQLERVMILTAAVFPAVVGERIS